ncbi:hypothetical protein [Longimicrobium terrae]|uniref:Tetratricopeptide repeat protein n=1 Tax=Longimicrobium terrae TaxID=1639882 RepID=A0A841H3B4_9BACT|nr:hypothetical protein [Longimicrobium terrae]MBB4637816.1 hypothetical protein [Longimicrobium terrae]MBB6072329.1 hypothetical protein [Longimicrobium terrae]NNC31249.1 hypothetical protein [Longimicrobium terrae]
MPAVRRRNPIEQRLDELGARWLAFTANPRARLLRWVAGREDVRMVSAFVEVQNEEIGEMPDLFIRLESPFEARAGYSAALVAALRAQYDETREGLAEEGIPGEWTPPDPPGPHPFAAAVTSLYHYHADLMDHLAIVLAPESVSDVAAWQGWMLAVLPHLPENVRILVVDSADSPALEGLDADRERVVSEALALDMDGAMTQLARGSGSNDPGDRFRRAFLGVAQASGRGDMTAAARDGRAALSIAERMRWSDMQVAVHAALGAGYLASGRLDDALASYRRGRVVSEGAVGRKEPGAEKLLVQARLSEAGALVGDKRWAEAAPLYADTAPVAQQAEDALMTMESWRMAAYCHEQAGASDEAWRCAEAALKVGEGMKAEERSSSTLPYVGAAMLRLADARGIAPAQVNTRMEALLGPGWEPADAAAQPEEVAS